MTHYRYDDLLVIAVITTVLSVLAIWVAMLANESTPNWQIVVIPSVSIMAASTVWWIWWMRRIHGRLAVQDDRLDILELRTDELEIDSLVRAVTPYLGEVG